MREESQWVVEEEGQAQPSTITQTHPLCPSLRSEKLCPSLTICMSWGMREETDLLLKLLASSQRLQGDPAMVVTSSDGA